MVLGVIILIVLYLLLLLIVMMVVMMMLIMMLVKGTTKIVFKYDTDHALLLSQEYTHMFTFLVTHWHDFYVPLLATSVH